MFVSKRTPVRLSLASEVTTVVSSTFYWLEILLSLKETLAHTNNCGSTLIYIFDEINIKQINAEDELSFHSCILQIVCVHRLYVIYMKRGEMYLIKGYLSIFHLKKKQSQKDFSVLLCTCLRAKMGLYLCISNLNVLQVK